MYVIVEHFLQAGVEKCKKLSVIWALNDENSEKCVYTFFVVFVYDDCMKCQGLLK